MKNRIVTTVREPWSTTGHNPWITSIIIVGRLGSFFNGFAAARVVESHTEAPMEKMSARKASARPLLFAAILFALVAQSCGNLFPPPSPYDENPDEAERLTILADIHLPYKASKLENAAEGEARTAAKLAMRDEINAWTDTSRVILTGDIVGERGCPDEYAVALSYISGLSSQVRPIAGNHEYTYSDEFGPAGSLVLCEADERARKLEYFKTAMGLESLQREEELGGYELIYLSSGSLDTSRRVGISPESLAWLDDCLSAHASLPTIIFFHAPLEGTLNVKGKPASGSSVAQPADAIHEILGRHPQVFLWVSGHTHTRPSNASFASPINLYDGRVMNIHCPDSDRIDPCTNSLWLYPNHVLIRTYDHRRGAWLTRLDRRVAAWGR